MINQSQWQNDWPTGGGCRPQLITLTFTRSIHSRSNIVSIATVRYNTWKIGGKSPENNKSETTNRKQQIGNSVAIQSIQIILNGPLQSRGPPHAVACAGRPAKELVKKSIEFNRLPSINIDLIQLAAYCGRIYWENSKFRSPWMDWRKLNFYFRSI